MERLIDLHIERLRECVFLATSNEVQRLVTQGRTVSETLEIARDVARRLLKFSGLPSLTCRLEVGAAMNASLRSAVLAEWRGLPEKKQRLDRWKSPGELLPKLMQQFGLRERLREAEVIEAWTQIVGEFIAAHSQPSNLREGVLFVRVLQPALHYQFETISKPEILRKLKQRFGTKVVRDVRFRIG